VIAVVDARRATWWCCLLSTAATGVLLAVTGTGVAIPPLLMMMGCIAILGGVHLVYTRWRPEPRVADLTGGLAAVFWAGLSAGVLALAALRMGAPLVDATLAHLDAALLIDTPALVRWVARRPLVGEVLDIVYLSAVPMVFTTVALLAIRQESDRMWEICFSFAGASFLSALALTFMPAVAAFTFLKIDSEIVAGLPDGSGKFFLSTLEGFRSGRLSQIDIFHLEGVVTFPSFHAAMACMIAYALRHIRVVGHLGWVWCAVVLVSTVPIGGHYAIDVLGGALLWGAFALIVRYRIGPQATKVRFRVPAFKSQIG